MKIVKIKDNEIIIWFGGVCCKPSACLSNEKTIISLVKLVTIKISVGANTKRVKITAILIVFTNCAGSSSAAIERFTTGGAGSCANNNEIEKISKLNISFKYRP